MKKLIVANWKMNPISTKEAVSLAKKIDAGIPKTKHIEVVIAPPFPFLAGIGKAIHRAKLGAQDAFWEGKGAYTGEVSPSQLKRLGVEYVIIGHSERRTWLHETDEMIHKKVLASLRAGLKVVLCVGEPLAIRKKGLTTAKNFVRNQLLKDLRGIGSLKIENCLPAEASAQAGKLKIIVAYEPIWAIGTGKFDKPKDVAETAKFIKKFLHTTYYILHTKVLYGGSVTSRNVRSFVYCKGIDGALVGGASLKAEEFKKIIQISLQNNG